MNQPVKRRRSNSIRNAAKPDAARTPIRGGTRATSDAGADQMRRRKNRRTRRSANPPTLCRCKAAEPGLQPGDGRHRSRREVADTEAGNGAARAAACTARRYRLDHRMLNAVRGTITAMVTPKQAPAAQTDAKIRSEERIEIDAGRRRMLTLPIKTSTRSKAFDTHEMREGLTIEAELPRADTPWPNCQSRADSEECAKATSPWLQDARSADNRLTRLISRSLKSKPRRVHVADQKPVPRRFGKMMTRRTRSPRSLSNPRRT